MELTVADGSSRLEPRPGDSPKVTADCGSDRGRVEMSEQLPALRIGSEYWSHFVPYVLAEHRSSQYQARSVPPEGDRKPPILFQLDDDVSICECSDPSVRQVSRMALEQPRAQIRLKSAAAMKGGCTNVIVHAK